MILIKVAIGIALGAVISISANAKPNLSQEFCGDRYCGQYQTVQVKQARNHNRKVAYKAKRSAPVKVASAPDAAPGGGTGGVNSIGSDLVAAAERYLGTNPTGWRSVWCGRFMALIAPSAAAKVRNPNWARDWAVLRRTGPRIGAIAVLTRGKGGHIGVVAGFDGRGNPIIISGNHNRVVGKGVYSKHRVLAYVEG